MALLTSMHTANDEAPPSSGPRLRGGANRTITSAGRRQPARRRVAAGAASAARPPGAAGFTGPRRDPTRSDGPRLAVPDGPPQLSARELEVLRRLGEAQSAAQIAAGLAVSTNTVRGHVRTLVRKPAATGRDDAVRRAREPKLL